MRNHREGFEGWTTIRKRRGGIFSGKCGSQYFNVVGKLVLFLIFIFVLGGSVMANNFENGIPKPGAFSLSWSGGLQYGSREMTFDGEEKFYFAKGDTINDDHQTGVGVFSLSLQNSDVLKMNDVARAL
nr:hypothetical protein [Burkholderia ambifaria]